MPINDVQLTEDRWLDFFEHYKGTPGQKRGLLMLRKHIIQADPGLLTESAQWVEESRKQEPAPPQRQVITKDSPFSARLTPNFTYGEFTLGQEIRRFTQNFQIATAIELAQFCERVRAHFGGRRVRITSGHRPPTVNRSIGGASGSEHLFDAPGVGAVDIVVEGVPTIEVQRWVDQNWPYSVGYGAPKGFVHIGIRRGRPRVRWDY